VRDVKVEIKGLKEVQDAIRAYQGDISRQVNLITKSAAMGALNDVKKAIDLGPKTGNVYYRIPGPKYMTVRRDSQDGPIVAVFRAEGKQNLSLRHQASAPGQAPATDTGSLLRSLYFKALGAADFAIGSDIPYSYYLEFGTRKIAKRPAWVPAVERTIPKMLKQVQIAIEKAKARAEKTTK
jgi:hypothetical protein